MNGAWEVRRALRWELLPCPFCGSANLKSGGDDKVVSTWCLDCEATGPNHYGKTEWNTRASMPQTLPGMIAAIYGGMDAEDCSFIDFEWARQRGYILPDNGTGQLAAAPQPRDDGGQPPERTYTLAEVSDTVERVIRKMLDDGQITASSQHQHNEGK